MQLTNLYIHELRGWKHPLFFYENVIQEHEFTKDHYGKKKK